MVRGACIPPVDGAPATGPEHRRQGSTMESAVAVEVRRAGPGDATAIAALVRGERLNPSGLDWRRFHVAKEGGAIIGAVQVRLKGPELGSLVVRKDRRRQGVATRLLAAALDGQLGQVFLIAPATLAGLYARHGFVPLAFWRAPARVSLNLALGQAFGSLHALLVGRRPRRLKVLVRPRSEAAPRDRLRSGAQGAVPM